MSGDLGELAQTTGVGSDALADIAQTLRAAGSTFGFIHGSRARGEHRVESDIDVAAWWHGAAPAPYDVLLPSGVDLLILNDAPLELAGRVALEGLVLLDDDPIARVRWLATTRKIYADEQPRLLRGHREFAEARRQSAEAHRHGR